MLPKNFMLIHILFYFFLLMWRFKILIGCFSYMYIYVCVCVSGDLSLVDLFNWLHDVLFMKDFYLILWDVKSFKSFVKTSILVNLFVFFCVIACFFVFGGFFLLFFFKNNVLIHVQWWVDPRCLPWFSPTAIIWTPGFSSVG